MTIDLDERNGNIIAGGGGTADGDLVLRDKSGRGRIHLDAIHENPYPFSDGDDVTVFVDGKHGRIRLGGNGSSGSLKIRGSDGRQTYVSDHNVSSGSLSSRGAWFVGTDDTYASIIMYQPTLVSTGESLGEHGYTVRLSSDGSLRLGDGEVNGSITLTDKYDTNRVAISGGRGSPLADSLHDNINRRTRVGIDGETGQIWVGGGAVDRNSYGFDSSKDSGRDGRVTVRDRAGEESVVLDGASDAVVLRSPNGSRFRVTVDDTGSLRTTAV